MRSGIAVRGDPARPGIFTPSQAIPTHLTYHFTRISRNAKTGPMPVTTTSKNSCPPSCSYRAGGCYANGGPLALHWHAVSEGHRGGSFEELLEDVATVRRGALWRHNQAGDLTPTSTGELDVALLDLLVQANQGRRGFTYTHYEPRGANREALRRANNGGFTVNLSAESLRQADSYVSTACAPVVVALPSNARQSLRTPEGRLVVVCPAVLGDTDCLNCGLCQRADRRVIVGLPAHGGGARRVEQIFLEEGAT